MKTFLKASLYLTSLIIMAWNPWEFFGPWPTGNYYGLLLWLMGFAVHRDWASKWPAFYRYKAPSLLDPYAHTPRRWRDLF